MTAQDRDEILEILKSHTEECTKVNGLTFFKKPPVLLTISAVVAIISLAATSVYAYWSGLNSINSELGKKIEYNMQTIAVIRSEQHAYQESLKEFKAEIREDLKTQAEDIKTILRSVNRVAR